MCGACGRQPGADGEAQKSRGVRGGLVAGAATRLRVRLRVHVTHVCTLTRAANQAEAQCKRDKKRICPDTALDKLRLCQDRDPHHRGRCYSLFHSSPSQPLHA